MTRRATALAVFAAGILAVPTAAQAVDITSPPHQSGVLEGTTVMVKGGDCPSGHVVRVFFAAAPQKDASTTSGPDGSWSVGLPVPTLAVGEVEEASEQSVVAECAGDRDSVVVAYGAGDAELAYTGPAPTAAVVAVGALLVVLGAGFAHAGRRRDQQLPRAADSPRARR